MRTFIIVATAALCSLACDKESASEEAPKAASESEPPKVPEAQVAFNAMLLAAEQSGSPLKFDGIKRSAAPDEETFCGAMGGDLDAVEVTGVTPGVFNAKESYWPLKVDLSGVCLSQIPNCGDDNNQLCPATREPIELKDLTVKMTKDDFGAWKMEIMGDGARPWGL